MILLNIDENSSQPKYRQIIEQIRLRIESRALLPGEKLPSTRRLADKLGIHRSTVTIAYQELWALGYIDLKPGTTPSVRDRMKMVTTQDRDSEGIIDWEAIASPAGNTVRQAWLDFLPRLNLKESASLINFRNLHMDQRLFPLETFRSCLNRALKKHGRNLLGYGGTAGFLLLREYIAHRLQTHGISVSAEEVLITDGSQHGIDMVFRMLAEPGKAVAFESPSYNYMLPLLRFTGLKPIEIPLRREGMDLNVLEHVLHREHPALVYTMPNFQNPTGISTSQAHRERLLSLCTAHRTPILEDGFEEEMKYFGKVVLPIKSMDKKGLVIYCGTFSKVLFPGTRIGWIAAPKECLERIMAIRCFSQLFQNQVLQAGIHEFCINGYYDRHIGKMHRIFRKRMQTAIQGLRRYISPDWAQWSEPGGGFLIWLKLKPVKEEDVDWQSLLASFGVAVTPGKYFFYTQTPDTYLRLSISTLNEEEILEGMQRMAQAFSHVYK